MTNETKRLYAVMVYVPNYLARGQRIINAGLTVNHSEAIKLRSKCVETDFPNCYAEIVRLD